MVDPRDKLKLWWKTKSPESKQKLKFAGLAAGVIGAVVLGGQLAGTGNNTHTNAELKKAEAIKSSVLLEAPASQGPATMQAEIDNLTSQIKKLTKITAAENGLTKKQENDLSGHISKSLLEKLKAEHAQEPNAPVAPNPQIQQLENNIAALQNQISTMRQQPRTQTVYHPAKSWAPAASIVELGQKPARNSMNNVPTSTAPNAPGVPGAPKAPKTLETVSTATPTKLSQITHVVKVKSKKGVYLPAGTILTGVTLNGLQAGTGPQAKSNPQIVDIRVKKRAILPNGIRVNLENCMAIASGYGSIANHRVYMRTNELSCVARGGKVVSAPIHAYIVGSDGMVGVSGKVVSHQGPVILKSLLAGIFSGLGQAAQPTSVEGLNLNPTNGSSAGFQSFSPSYLGESALAGGISTPAGMISKFYLNEAEQMLPVIQINPAVSVSMILESGVRVHTDGESKSELEQAQYQSAESLNNTPGQAPAPSTSPYGESSPYSGAGQSPAVANAFPNRETVEREDQAGQQPNLEGQP
ncbi:conjugal transfer protein [Acidithiobacillus thiooxidans]|uniref:TrbI/VirB10 family protein n=1 Tax=Acidithiobacillus thiooxidans TaxID=930 RepID=UPI000262503C|nr:TrbI/VirB10 family protein [Acidithiobacillus thiooxidans]MBU2792697.1 conjugal transfer protein [Acidithiobacillus thiooxidans]MBU2811803.1 conjugal transfer protein [Acidithiobacillus thiooxidans]